VDYVLDASVAIKWFVEEDLSHAARTLLTRFGEGGIELHAPLLLVYEVGNALWRLVNKLRVLEAAFAVNSYSSFLRLPINYIEIDEMHARETLRIAVDLDLPLYDAAYVALSRRLDRPLVTCDDEIIRKTRRTLHPIHLKSIFA
jgi:predicted nucleic acid-binding protein